jgi:hypothetical protein
MHLTFFVRGKIEQVKLWEAHAQSSYWKLRKFNNKTKKEEIILVQGGLRPSVFGSYEYIFPKEALVEVLALFGITNDGIPSFDLNSPFKQFKGKMKMKILEKMFGCKKIPKKILEEAKIFARDRGTFSTEEFERGCSNCIIPGVAIHVIGIKDDRPVTNGDYTYEGL